MCTALTFTTKDHYFGRSLDLEYSYHETVTVMPRKMPLRFRQAGSLETHLAMIGMAYVVDGFPLYYDAVNEKGLGMAGLNFPGNAVYHPIDPEKDNIGSFEFIPWILSQCATVKEARKQLERMNLATIDYSKELPASPLHWMIADREESIVVESMKDGLRVHDNPVGVMTNNPPFETQLFNLTNYMALSTEPPENNFAKQLDLKPYSRGMGGMGLPGDLSSASRFVKVAFTRLNSVCGDDESASISQFFHILGSVAQQRGLVHMGHGQYEISIYTSCCNTTRGIYYYTTYENNQITAVDMHRENLDGTEVVTYPLVTGQQIKWQNR